MKKTILTLAALAALVLITGAAVSVPGVLTITRDTTVRGDVTFAGAGVSQSGNTFTFSGAGGSGDALSQLLSAEVAITGTTTLTSSAFGKMHKVSGTSADYTITLPAAATHAGKLIGFRMENGLTKLVTLDGNGSETLNGATTRVMWRNEIAVLLCDGSNWTKVWGHSIPMATRMTRTTTVSGGIATSTVTKIPLNAIAFDPSSAMADTTNTRINIRRAGVYQVSGLVTYDAIGASQDVQTRIHHNGVSVTIAASAYGSAGWYPAASASILINAAVNDTLELYAHHASGATEQIYVVDPVNWLAVTEVPEW